MSRSQYHLLTGNLFPAVYDDSGDLPVLRFNLCHLTLKTDFPTQTQDLFPHAFYDSAQDIRTDMGLCLVNDRRIGTMTNKGFQYFRISAVFILYQSI